MKKEHQHDSKADEKQRGGASTISNFTTLIDCMRASPRLPTTSRRPILNTSEFFIVEGMTMKEVLMSVWTHPCLNPLSQGKENA